MDIELKCYTEAELLFMDILKHSIRITVKYKFNLLNNEHSCVFVHRKCPFIQY